MKAINKMKIVFPAKSVNESFARGVVSSFAVQADPTVMELADIKTAVSEAVTNCIIHAYPDMSGDITLTAILYEDMRIVITIADKGVGIADVEKAMEPTYTTGGSERAGLGFAVMSSFSDRMRVTSREGKGTRITLTKFLGT